MGQPNSTRPDTEAADPRSADELHRVTMSAEVALDDACNCGEELPKYL